MTILVALLIIGFAYWIVTTRNTPEGDARTVVVRNEVSERPRKRSRVIDD